VQPAAPPPLRGIVGRFVRALKGSRLISRRTSHALKFDLLRLRARFRHPRAAVQPDYPRLHLGCGKRRVTGWLNVDVAGSDYDVDLASGALPWSDGSFDQVVSQQVIEHLDLDTELIPLLVELRRVLRPGGEIWLSTPDLERICDSYAQDRGRLLEADRKARWPDFNLAGKPPQHMLNVLFHQGGEHQNLFDYDFLEWLMQHTGFTGCERTDEEAFLRLFPEFPRRDDDRTSVYLRARVP
jgi:predicted SAM-dependent methyltransferase